MSDAVRILSGQLGTPTPRPEGGFVAVTYYYQDGKRKKLRAYGPTMADCLQDRDQQVADLVAVGSDNHLTLQEIADYKLARSILPAHIKVSDAAQEWRKLHPGNDAITVSQALQRYLDDFRGEATTLSTCQSLVARLTAKLGQKALQAVTTHDIKGIVEELQLAGYEGTSINNHIRFWTTFFNWVNAHDDLPKMENPAKPLKRFDEGSDEIDFLAIEDVERLLHTAQARDPKLLPALVLNLFAGIRPYEVRKLPADKIRFSNRTIRIDASVAKRAPGRALPRNIKRLPDAVWTWLEHCRECTGGKLILDVRDIDKRRQRLCQIAGIKWSHSVGRHTFASYAMAKYQDIGLVGSWTGHRVLSTIHDHYDGAADPDDADVFFSLRPAEAIVPIERPKQKTVDWPTDELMTQWAWEMPMTLIADRLGCSDLAVRKHMLKRGIPRPPRGHWERLRLQDKNKE